jgi:hypothetical protein
MLASLLASELVCESLLGFALFLSRLGFALLMLR